MSSYIKSLTDDELWNETLRESEVERNSTLKVIAFLQEINLRRLHLKRGYSSLHEYCVHVLKYSDGAAHRRIKSMLLVEDLPETKRSIEMGSLNLTTASQIQKVIEIKKKSRVPLSQIEKLDLFKTLDGKSKREVEKRIAAICPELTLQVEKQRYVTQDKIQKTLIISEGLHEKIEKLKSLRAHENKDFVAILEELVDRELKRVDPLAKPAKNQTASPEKQHSRYVSAEIKREVWGKNNGQCAYVDQKTGKKCASTHFLQIDHIIPFAKGGPTIAENLRLLCANHNQMEARNHFAL